MRYIFILFTTFFLTSCHSKESPKTVLLSITAKNKGHTIERYLRCIDRLEYDKKAITVRILTGCNEDQTETILRKWADGRKEVYKEIIFLTTDDPGFDQDLTSSEHKEAVLRAARNVESDFCFIVDPVSFIAPTTLKTLVAKDLPVVAPMLRPIPELNDNNTNFFAAVSEYGYYQDDPEYWLIFNEVKKGTFTVPVIHCTYLLRSDTYEKVSYIGEAPDFEFLNFGRQARKNGIDQFICNEEDFGVFIHFYGTPSLEEQKKRLQYIFSLPSL